MPFGKPGRPAKDRLQEQQRIYEAAVPLLRRDGVRRLSMREVAQAAHLSTGGLYHYFPNKRALVLHGLNPEARDRICRGFRTQAAAAGAATPEEYLETYLEVSARLLAFVRPAVLAAIELGVGTLQAELDRGLEQNVSELCQALSHVAPGTPREDLLRLAYAVRRLGLGALVDANADLDRVREQLRLLIPAPSP